MELFGENNNVDVDDFETDRGTLPHLKEVKGYLRCEQPKEFLREFLKEEMRDQGRKEWYECQTGIMGENVMMISTRRGTATTRTLLDSTQSLIF